MIDNKTASEETASQSGKSGNLRVAAICAGLVVAMTGLSFAAVPLYQVFCQVTGYGGTTKRAEIAEDMKIGTRQMTVRFDANLAPGLDWQFKPVQRSVELKPGEKVKISYTATNLSDKTLSGTATFNVTPQAAGAYFNKVECFCFTETTLKPGETLDMPVVFFIDPDVEGVRELENIHTITLSYTMFPDKEANEKNNNTAANGTLDEAAKKSSIAALKNDGKGEDNL